ncbi:hypothetical protein BH11MYX3_BH11MYX3_09360 [soil metagenome]
MTDALRSVIEQRFAVTRIDATAARLNATIEVDQASYRATLIMEPSASIVVALPCIDGFELRVRWTDRWANSGAPRAASFDDSFLIETNDLALATIWLDHVSRSALLSSRYVSSQQLARSTALLWRDAAWIHEIAHDQVRADRADAELSPERMGDLLGASLLLAARPARWARALEPVGRSLGADAAPRVEVGGKPILRVRRGAVDVTVHIARRLGPGDTGRLRTIVSAHRHGSGGETLSLIAEDLPRAAWPPPNAPGPLAMTIDPRAAELLEIARPSASTVRPHDVEIAFDGALSDARRMGAAIELAAWWAREVSGTGPYR